MLMEKRRKNVNYKRIISVALVAMMLAALPCRTILAETDGNRHYMGDVVNTGKDNGYSGANEIDKNDPHFNWTLGKFYVDGYTRVVNGETDYPVFLKNVGDTVTLWFDLMQDISCLNGDETLLIYSDANGYDEVFDIPPSDFGRGTLIIRYTDYQNNTAEPVVYRDYLAADASLDADTKVQLCEEGDYEVSLLYEIQKNGFWIADSYTNYRISFKFSVRNGNAMVFPFDVHTGQELTNSAFTENGFYLDLAKSRYLDIDIKKEVLKAGADGLVEDTRFNRPAKDGEPFTDEGIYTITVTNKYTGNSTVKRIYVGTNSVLRAHVVTGLSISEIEEQIAAGAVITTEGTIVMPTPTPTATPIPVPEGEKAVVNDVPAPKEEKDNTEVNQPQQEKIMSINKWIPIIVVVSVGLALVIVIETKRVRAEKKGKQS